MIEPEYISKQAIISFLREQVPLDRFMRRTIDKADRACAEICDRIQDELETAEVQQIKTGRWIRIMDCGAYMLKCTACRGRVKEMLYTQAIGTAGKSYCPYCGAKMEGNQ